MGSNHLMRGVIPGVMAGYLFLAYAGGGMQEMVGGMIDSNDFMGFIMHIVFSAVIGALYTGYFKRYVSRGPAFMNIVVGGLVYGLIWWILGANLIMPLIAGGDVLGLAIGTSFYGHIIFGHSLAFLVTMRDLLMKSE